MTARSSSDMSSAKFGRGALSRNTKVAITRQSKDRRGHTLGVTKRGMRRNVARCNACGSVVESTHPWDVATCSCGALTVSGGTARPHRAWNVSSGAGWSELQTVVLVFGSGPGLGKSTLARGLAEALTQRGRRVRLFEEEDIWSAREFESVM